MKKSAFSAALVFVGALATGCPVYEGNDIGCFDDLDCLPGYVCDERALCVSAGSGSGSCSEPDDCASNETCSRSGICEAGDCHFESVGCVRGYECSGVSGRWQCEPETPNQSGGGGEPAASGGAPTSGGEPATSGGARTNGGEPAASGGAPGAD